MNLHELFTLEYFTLLLIPRTEPSCDSKSKSAYFIGMLSVLWLGVTLVSVGQSPFAAEIGASPLELPFEMCTS